MRIAATMQPMVSQLISGLDACTASVDSARSTEKAACEPKQPAQIDHNEEPSYQPSQSSPQPAAGAGLRKEPARDERDSHTSSPEGVGGVLRFVRDRHP
jgi:hypothetical protein